jgi:hypothetical protein
MAQGPNLIFDKSALQSLSLHEAVWLDNFFTSNITPLFFMETLADLEKEVRGGRTPEDVVGDLALKTPDLHSNPNAHHLRLMESELRGWDTVAMDGRGVLTGGRPVTLNGQKGIIFPRSPEEEAFHRWQLGEFLELERGIAKAWRRALLMVDQQARYRFFRETFLAGKKLKTLSEAKALSDEIIDRREQESALKFGLSLFNVSKQAQVQIIERWRCAGKPEITQFVPYFRYVYSVELFFYLALGADLISRDRPSNKIDVAYLYYLPFCKVFTSKDKLHDRIVPLFLRSDQTYVKGADLKADLAKLEAHYSALPDEVKVLGLSRFASTPPEETSFLVTQLWDRHLPKWRQLKADEKEPSPELREALLKLVLKIDKESEPSSSAEYLGFDEATYVKMERKVMRRKGNWHRFDPNVK